MRMLSRRTQLLLDDQRFERVRREAERSGNSVGAVIRRAIDEALPPEEDAAARRRAAGERLLAEPPPHGPEPNWEDVKDEMLDALYGNLPERRGEDGRRTG